MLQFHQHQYDIKLFSAAPPLTLTAGFAAPPFFSAFGDGRIFQYLKIHFLL